MTLSLAAVQAQCDGARREVYYILAGGSVSDLTTSARFPEGADEAFIENAFEALPKFADNYGQRMRALLLPSAVCARRGNRPGIPLLPHSGTRTGRQFLVHGVGS